MIYWSKAELSSITLSILRKHSRCRSNFEWSLTPASAHLVSPSANSLASWCPNKKSRQIQKRSKLSRKWSPQGWSKKYSIWQEESQLWTDSSLGRLKKVFPSSKLLNRQRTSNGWKSVKLHSMTWRGTSAHLLSLASLNLEKCCIYTLQSHPLSLVQSSSGKRPSCKSRSIMSVEYCWKIYPKANHLGCRWLCSIHVYEL